MHTDEIHNMKVTGNELIAEVEVNRQKLKETRQNVKENRIVALTFLTVLALVLCAVIIYLI